MAEELSLDDFLGHDTSAGKRAAYFGKWQGKNGGGKAKIVLHAKSPIAAVWQYPWPRLVTRKVDGVEEIQVWGGTFNTWEGADVCRKQYRRDKQTGERDLPPTVCPFAMFVEDVFQKIQSGQLDWTAKLFHFEGDGSSHAITLHAGGMLGLFTRDDVDTDQKKLIRAAGINIGNSWKEKTLAKCNYVFRLVDVNNPEAGVQVAQETTLLGDKVKTAINKEIASEGRAKGNPMMNPYVIEFSHHPNSKTFNDRYDATVLRREAIEDNVRTLVCDTDKPSISHLTERGNPMELRVNMEQHYCGPGGLFDWDELFGAACDEWADDTDQTAAPAQAATSQAPAPGPNTTAVAVQGVNAALDAVDAAFAAADKAADAKPAEAPAAEAPPAVKPKKRKAKAKPKTRVIPENKQCLCVECDAVIHEDDEKCPHCGFDYTAGDGDTPAEVAPAATGTTGAKMNF